MEPFPLTWPVSYPRTEYPESHGGFRRNHTPKQEYDELLAEMKRLKADQVVVSCNIPMRRDGVTRDWDRLLKSMEDKGVAVYFKLDGNSQVLACDAWDELIHNLRALTKTIEALRGLDRYKASQILKRAFSGLKELPEAAESLSRWWEILEVPRSAPAADIKAAYRRLVAPHHPDHGGDAHQFNRIASAFEGAQKERGVRM
jgi:hypothetical protein